MTRPCAWMKWVRGCIAAFPAASPAPHSARGLLSSREKKGRWKLKIKGAPKHRIQLEVSLGARPRSLPGRGRGDLLKGKRWSVKKGVLRASFKTRGAAPDGGGRKPLLATPI